MHYSALLKISTKHLPLVVVTWFVFTGCHIFMFLPSTELADWLADYPRSLLMKLWDLWLTFLHFKNQMGHGMEVKKNSFKIIWVTIFGRFTCQHGLGCPRMCKKYKNILANMGNITYSLAWIYIYRLPSNGRVR